MMKEDPSLKSNYQIPPLVAQPDFMADFRIGSLDQAPEPPAKPSPDRYRRTQRRSDPNIPTVKDVQSEPAANMATTQTLKTAQVAQFYQAPQQVNLASIRNSNASPRFEPLAAQPSTGNSRTVESEAQPVRQYASETAKRYRQQRNSSGSQDNGTIKMVLNASAPPRVAPSSAADDQITSTRSNTSRPSFVSNLFSCHYAHVSNMHSFD